MASTNPDSMTNAQGEFHPSKPRDQPMTTKGHQVGQKVGNDAVPEFHAKVLPPGSAPASKTYQPNPVDESTGQADNQLAREQGVTPAADPLDMPGATSADVHTGLGHPGSGQLGSEIRHGGSEKRENHLPGIAGQQLGGSGMTGDDSVEARRLQRDHVGGPVNAREHNASLEGAENKLPVSSEELAAESRNVMQRDYDRQAEKPPGKHS